MKHYELHLTNYEIAGAHNLVLPYDSPCQNLHGHNWLVSVHIKANELAAHGMILDFKHIKDYLKTYDHSYINETLKKYGYEDLNPTAENMAEVFAKYIIEQASKEGCTSVYEVRVDVQEAEHNVASYVWNRD